VPSERVHLVTGLLERADALLLVASRYPNRRDVLWNLPGGRQRDGELLGAALAREFLEETGLAIERGPLAYVAESYDRATGVHFVNFAFHVSTAGEPVLPPDDAHVSDMAWVAKADLPAKLAIAVVREPLLAYLGGARLRYTGFDDAGVTIEFADPA